MSMVRTAGRVVIQAPASAAWEVLGDYAHDPAWRSGVSRMEQTPPGRVQNGATAEEDLRVLGREVRTRIELHDVRDGGFSWRAVDGTHAHGTRTVAPLDSGRCELRTDREIRLVGADRLLAPLVRWAMSRAEHADLARAAALVERRHAAGGVLPGS